MNDGLNLRVIQVHEPIGIDDDAGWVGSTKRMVDEGFRHFCASRPEMRTLSMKEQVSASVQEALGKKRGGSNEP